MRVVSILALCLSALVSSHAQAPSLVFVNVAVVPMDREVVLRDQTVVIRGDRIVDLGPSSTVKPPAGATTVDGTGK